MATSIGRKILMASCVLLALSCSSEKEADGAAAVSQASEILRYVPADSPYVIAAIRPVPDEVVDKVRPNVDRLLAAYRTLLQGMLDTPVKEGDEVSPGDAGDAKLARTLEELSSLLSVEDLGNAGFSRKSRSVLYAHGLLPVLRFEVSDGKLFEARLRRVEEALGEDMDRMEMSGRTVRVVTANPLRYYVLVDGDQVVLALAPAAFDDSQAGTLLGFAPPADNIVDAGYLQDIAGQYAFDSHVLGYVDFRRLFESVAGDGREANRDVLAAFGLAGEREELSTVCRDEMLSLVEVMPRVVMGSTEVSVERMQSRAVFELREDIAKSLLAVSSPVPGLGSGGGGLMSFGMGVNAAALRDFLIARVEAVATDPYKCELLAELQVTAAQLRDTLQTPVPPVYYDIRGLVANIDNIETPAISGPQQFASVDGQFLLAMRDAPAVVLLGEALLPELAALNLEPNGVPVRLDLSYTQSLDKQIFVALNEQALAISVGKGGETKLSDMLTAPPPEEGTLVSFTINNERHYAALLAALEQEGASNDEAMKTSVAEIMTVYGKMFPRASMDVRIEELGIVFDNNATLGD